MLSWMNWYLEQMYWSLSKQLRQKTAWYFELLIFQTVFWSPWGFKISRANCTKKVSLFNVESQFQYLISLKFDEKNKLKITFQCSPWSLICHSFTPFTKLYIACAKSRLKSNLKWCHIVNQTAKTYVSYKSMAILAR